MLSLAQHHRLACDPMERKSMKAGRVAASVGVVLVFALVLAACRTEEQGRVLLYDKGEYLGKPDSRLSEDQVRMLSVRPANQRGGG